MTRSKRTSGLRLPIVIILSGCRISPSIPCLIRFARKSASGVCFAASVCLREHLPHGLHSYPIFLALQEFVSASTARGAPGRRCHSMRNSKSCVIAPSRPEVPEFRADNGQTAKRPTTGILSVGRFSNGRPPLTGQTRSLRRFIGSYQLECGAVGQNATVAIFGTDEDHFSWDRRCKCFPGGFLQMSKLCSSARARRAQSAQALCRFD